MSQMFSAVFFFYFSTILDLFAWIPLPSSFLLSSLWLLPLSWRSSPVLFQNSLGITKGAQLLTLTLFPLISTTPWHSRCNPTLGRIWDQGRGRTGQIELDACAQAKAEQLDREVLGAFEIGWVLKKKKNVQTRWCTELPGCCKWSLSWRPGTHNRMKQQWSITLMEGTRGHYRWSLKMFHQRNRIPEARLSSSAMTNKLHEEGRNTFTRGSTGKREGTEGSHLQNHNRADYLWWV